jgi:hypothetical protein
MTLFGWIFWGIILLLIIIAVVLQKIGIKPPPEKTSNQQTAENQAHESSKINYPGDGSN